MVVKMALEPQWEAKFEPNSYGFRPGRSPMDAVSATYHCLWFGERYVLNGDIRKCFDTISHNKLLNKIQSTKSIQKQIHSWLKAGIIDPSNNSKLEENTAGTPQGGIISPLLSNIALHGLENHCLKEIRPILKRLNLPFTNYAYRLYVVRFADDFVVIHNHIDVIKELQTSILRFLDEEMDLKLSLEKTFICSTLHNITINNKVIKPGFEFLGFNFKIFRSTTYPAKLHTGKIIGFRPKLTPSFNAISKHLQHLKTICKESRGISQLALISRLSLVINGWTSYYKHCTATKDFSYCDFRLYKILCEWAYKRHPSKSRKWVLNEYFHRYRTRKWVFSCFPDRVIQKTLPFHTERKIVNYSKTSSSFSPFSLEANLKAHNMQLNKLQTTLFNRQQGYCKWCLGSIQAGDVLEIHHLITDKNHPK